MHPDYTVLMSVFERIHEIGILLAVGWLMEIWAAIVVVVPLIVPLGAAFGIHPVHLGIIFIANLELGFLTPLVGLNIFLASYRFKFCTSAPFRAELKADDSGERTAIYVGRGLDPTRRTVGIWRGSAPGGRSRPTA